MGIYGGGRRIITELGANEMPYGLALRHNNVYWTDWKKYVVQVFINVKNNTNNIIKFSYDPNQRSFFYISSI